MKIRELKPRLNRANRLLACLESFLDWWDEVQDGDEQNQFEEVWKEFVQIHFCSRSDAESIKEVAQRFLSVA